MAKDEDGRPNLGRALYSKCHWVGLWTIVLSQGVFPLETQKGMALSGEHGECCCAENPPQKENAGCALRTVLGMHWIPPSVI